MTAQTTNGFPICPPALAWLPHARFNLRYNPFGELTRQQRIAAAVVEIDDHVQWLVGARRAVQFIGDCGRGKSTHLLAMLHCFPTAAHVYLPAIGALPEIPHGDPLLIDEAQRLPWHVRWRVFRRGVPLILGTHTDLISPLTRAGYTVRTIHVSENHDGVRLCKILNRRIEMARLGPGKIPEITLDEAERLVERFGNDIRSTEAYLYERMRSLMRSNHGELPFVD